MLNEQSTVFFLEIISYFGDNIYLPILLTLIIVYYLNKRKYLIESVLLVISNLSVFYSYILKLLFAHERPQVVIKYMNDPFSYYGFPSSHVTYYVAFFGFLIYLTFKLKRLNIYLRRIFMYISFVMLSFIGISRVYLGFHYAKDAIAGYVFGILYLGFLILADKNIEYSKSKNQDIN